MKNIINNKTFYLLALLLVMTTTLLPLITLAQEEAVADPAPAPAQAEPSATITSSEPLAAEVAAPIQQTIESALLEAPVNPQEANTLEAAIQIIDQATAGSMTEIPIQISSTTPNIEITSSSTERVVDVIAIATSTEVAQLDLGELEPKKEYTFEINGSSVATEETPQWSRQKGENGQINSGEKVTDAPAIDIGESSHLLNVSGVCSDPYYVILIYKDSEGYNTNPSSYIYNRAFPCENGRYSYALSELPFSLESGTFYLLVAGQGNKGPWKPISAMIPIGIIVKTILPQASTTPHESTQ
jgi:hypothetical protein